MTAWNASTIPASTPAEADGADGVCQPAPSPATAATTITAASATT
jgi:hypothetical protein